MRESQLQSNIDALRAFVNERGWHIIDEKAIQSGYQLIVSDGVNNIPFDLFHTGKALIQRKSSPLQAELKAWWNTRKAPSSQPAAPTPAQSSFLETPTIPPIASFAGTPRIGCDESGKGDYFGPLVIAAVYVDLQSEQRLQEMGVRDSKLLTDNRMLMMAEEIKKLCPHIVVPVDPKRYNALYAKTGNLNRLLAWGHAWTLEQLLDKVPVKLAIIDQFGDLSYILNALLEKGRRITIEQRTRAEEDIAVAAASILARARFVQFVEQLSKSVGEALPKGASDPAIITVGRRIVAREGKDKLAEIAKLHFRTTEAILQS
ncbi:MAG TPA: ribonuclease HIII [Ktedonobacteraceae bacterium]|nr:ribonuclease HIII [Ktedonobacteraceae bacterium]